MNDIAAPVLLLVEDEAIILIHLEDVLIAAGFTVVAVTSAANALKEIEKDCGRFSALVTDIDIGKDKSGWDVARRAREICPNISVVYMSGGSHSDWSAFGVPKSLMIPKPFAPAQIVTAVATMMNEAAISTG